MTITRTVTITLLLVALTIVQLDAWSPVSIKNSDPTTTTALFAKEQSQPKRRFAQARAEKDPYASDSKIGSLYKERIKTAGRKGTKRFVDPCKVFVGNLSFDTDKKQLAEFVLGKMGQSRMVLHSFKVIEDWKTGKSKGYGFLEFTDPIYATVCMDVCNGKDLNGRPIKVSQGKKKDEEDLVYLEKQRKKAKNAEERAIASALDEAEDDEEELEMDEDGVAVFNESSDEDFELDAKLFGLDLDDDDEMDDGVFLEQKSRYKDDFDENLNREQRRDSARRRKRKKLPSKGFG
jgi:RNA recognition motif-containing protein